MSPVPLPNSFLDCLFLVTVGWACKKLEKAALRGTVQKAATKLMTNATFPAFIFQTLAAGGELFGFSAKVTVSATVIHMLLAVGVGWWLTRRQNRYQTALLTVLALGYEAQAWGVAWCSVVWGIAGAQSAVMVACTAAFTVPVMKYAIGAFTSMGIPAQVTHVDGGFYTGEWDHAVKEGLGIYWYKSGAMYEGWWKENVKHGFGVYHYANGGRFEGQFSNGKRNGIGIRIWPHGRVKAAMFENDRRVKDVELSDAAHIMQAACEAAAMARSIKPTRVTAKQAAKQSVCNAPFVSLCTFLLAAVFSIPVTETMDLALTAAASVHIPLSLALFGASIPSALPERRNAMQIRTILATRMLSSLFVGAGILMCATQSNEHVFRSAAIAACLLSPIPSQVFLRAREWNLGKPILDGVALMSYLLSLTCMGCFSIQAWIANVIPLFAEMPVSKIHTYALVDHCFVQIILLSVAAIFIPHLFVKRVTKMRLTADTWHQEGQHAQAHKRNTGSTPKGSVGATHRAIIRTLPRHRPAFTPPSLKLRARVPCQSIHMKSMRPVALFS